MTRSVWKGPFVAGHLIKKVQKLHTSSGNTALKSIKTWSRNSTILPIFVGVTFDVHNGKKFIPVSVSEDMVGKKLGEFAPTRTYKGHSGDKKIKKSG